MSLDDILDILRECDAESSVRYGDAGPKEVRLCHPDGCISVNDSGAGSPLGSTPAEYALVTGVDLTFQLPRKTELLNGVSLDTGKSPLVASQRVTSERTLPLPNRQDTGVLGFGEAKGGEDSSPRQDANRRDREIHELSPREKELRRPPSPFLLLDGDPTRPELPSRGRIIPIFRINRRTEKCEPDK